MTKTALNSEDTELPNDWEQLNANTECMDCSGTTEFFKQKDKLLAATVICLRCAMVWHTQP